MVKFWMWRNLRYGEIRTEKGRGTIIRGVGGVYLGSLAIWGVNPSNYMGRKPFKLYGVITPPQTDQKVGGGSAQQGGLLFLSRCSARRHVLILQTDQKSGGGPAQEGGSRQ